MADAGRVAGALMEREKAEPDWQVKAGLLPKARQSSSTNLLDHRAELGRPRRQDLRQRRPRGGRDGNAHRRGGRPDKFPVGVREIITEGAMPNPLDAHAVHPLLTALLAREAKMAVTASQEENRVVLGARSST